jgi:hypothetical protein
MNRIIILLVLVFSLILGSAGFGKERYLRGGASLGMYSTRSASLDNPFNMGGWAEVTFPVLWILHTGVQGGFYVPIPFRDYTYELGGPMLGGLIEIDIPFYPGVAVGYFDFWTTEKTHFPWLDEPLDVIIWEDTGPYIALSTRIFGRKNVQLRPRVMWFFPKNHSVITSFGCDVLLYGDFN